MSERNGLFDLVTRQVNTRLDETLQRISKRPPLCKRYLQGEGPQLWTYLQNTLCESRCRIFVLRRSTGNHLAEVLGLLSEHHSSGNRPVTCIRFTNAGNIQRIPRQHRIHLVRLVTEH